MRGRRTEHTPAAARRGRRRLRNLAPGMLWLAGLAACAAPAPRASELAARTLEVGGETRSYLLHAPPTADARPRALVVVFHGGGGDGRNALEQGRWVEKARAENFIVVAPEGTVEHPGRAASVLGNPRTWNSGGSTGTPAQRRGVDDVGFVRALIDEVSKQHAVEPGRIYATGLSNGGAMAFRAGLELSDRFAAIAPVANALLAPPQPLRRPVSLLMIWGSADPLNPIDGGSVRRSMGVMQRPSARESLQVWRRLLRCPGDAVIERESAALTLHAHRGCDGGATAQLLVVEGLGHQWPGGRIYLRAVAGPGSDAVDATDRIWRFFGQSARR